MITINSFEYYGPYVIEPSRHFFESMLRCNAPQGELISKNLIITENTLFDPHPFPLRLEQRKELVDKYIQYLKDSPSNTYYMVDVYVAPGHEKEVVKLMETDCSQRVICLLLLAEETRFAMQQVGKLDMLYCVAHLNELDADKNQLPVHMHMAFRAKEAPTEETLKAVKEITVADFAKANS